MSALEDSLRAVYKLEPRAMPNRGFLQAPQPMSEAEKLAKQAMSNQAITDIDLQDQERANQLAQSLAGPAPIMGVKPTLPVGVTDMDLQQAQDVEFTQEDLETLDRLLKQEAALESAPLGPLAQELRAQGLEEDTELAHVRLGEVILPPEFLDDDKFATTVENKFKAEGINPEEAVVGGIGTLNPGTGLQQFFLKKLAKGLKKVVKKVAPYAGLIAAPFTGGASAALIGGIGGAIGGGGIKGALKGAALGGAGSALFGGAGGAGGIGKFFNPAKGSTGIFGGQLGPNIRSGIGRLFRTPDFNPA